MESYVQEKLLICTWKHAGFAFCISPNAFLVCLRASRYFSKGFLQQMEGGGGAQGSQTLLLALLHRFQSRFACTQAFQTAPNPQLCASVTSNKPSWMWWHYRQTANPHAGLLGDGTFWGGVLLCQIRHQAALGPFPSKPACQKQRETQCGVTVRA